MHAGRTILPHKSLDWAIDRLRARLAERPDDHEGEAELALALLTEALYHGGGEPRASEALQHARRVVGLDPGHREALLVAAAALADLGRVEAARRYAEQAAHHAAPGDPLLPFVRGLIARAEGDHAAAIEAFEAAARAAPVAWEPQVALALALVATLPPGDLRAHQHLQARIVRALELDPLPSLRPVLLLELGRSLLASGRPEAAERVLVRLRDDPDRHREIRLLLGETAYQLGKYKNAIRWYEEALRREPDQAALLTRIAMARLQLGEAERARQAAERALLAAPGDPEARYALGCALLDLGQVPDALKAFRQVLHAAPDRLAAFVEMARTRRLARDVNWLVEGLHKEVGQLDRLPLVAGHPTPRSVTRERIAVLLGELREVGPSTLPAILGAMDLVQDEGVRFQLWEAATDIVAGAAADEVAERLRSAGTAYGPALGRQALATAPLQTEETLLAGLAIRDADLEQAALDRHPPTDDLTTHRRRLARERDRARAHQALVLLALATRRSRTARRTLESWADRADAELAVAARAGLAMHGDPAAAAVLVQRADAAGHGERVRALLASLAPPERPPTPRHLHADADARCATCGRTSREARHLMAGSRAVVCDACVEDTWARREELATEGDAACSFCGRTAPAARQVFERGGIHICTTCLDLSLGLLERDLVDRFVRGL